MFKKSALGIVEYNRRIKQTWALVDAIIALDVLEIPVSTY